MHRPKQLKPAKNMTDDDLLNEFRLAQSMARKRGQHLPLTVTKSDPENPTIHRPTVERDLDMFRREAHQKAPKPPQRVAQNTASDVAKGIGRANSIHGGVKGFLDGIGAIWSIKRMADEQQLNRYRSAGKIGMSYEEALDLYGPTRGARDAFIEGKRAAKQHREKYK